MQAVETIFQEYTKLRLNGLAAGEAVAALHPYVAALNSETRDELAQYLRAWESKRTETITQDDRQRLAMAAKARQSADTMPCPNCERPNVPHEVICYACGSLLHPEQAQKRTNVLPAKTGELQNDAYFGEEMILVLMPDTGDDAYRLYPQKNLRDLTIGRSDQQDYAKMDVDLERLDAVNWGVSRLHAAINYDAKNETISLMDLGSTNGTYLNEQRLHPNERRVIRNGDSLRFGRLKLQVFYRNN